MKKTGIHDRFYALLEQLPGAIKEQLVWEYSSKLTESLREFYARNPEGYRRMLADLQLQVSKTKNQPSADPELRKLRSGVLRALQKHGVDTTEWSKINSFLLQPRIAGKAMIDLNAEELRKLRGKLEMILQKDAEKQAEELRLSEAN